MQLEYGRSRETVGPASDSDRASLLLRQWDPPLTLTTPPSLTLVGPAHCGSGLYCGWDPAIPKAFVPGWRCLPKSHITTTVPGEVDPTTHPLGIKQFSCLHVHLLVAGLVWSINIGCREWGRFFLSLFIYCESWCPYLLTSEVSFTEWSLVTRIIKLTHYYQSFNFTKQTMIEVYSLDFNTIIT